MTLSMSQVLHNMPQGIQRRKAIIQYMLMHPDLPISVNRKWCIQLNQDRDLRYMLKKGILTRTRTTTSRTTRYTQLVLTINLKEKL